MFDRFSPFQRSLIGALAAFFGYGLWAYWVNVMHGPMAGFKTACVQGSYSFVLTFLMTLLIDVLYRFVTTAFDNETITKLLTIFISCAIIFSASWWVNVLAGTPEVFNTVVLGYIIGGIYSVSYVFGLSGKKTVSAAIVVVKG